MADLKVLLSAQDNLSGTLKSVNQSLKETNVQQDKLDKFRTQFNKISQSAAPLKRQLRDLQDIMTQMNFAGLDGSDVFRETAAYAGNVRDAMDDARQAVQLYADDLSSLKTGVAVFQGVAAAASTVTGAMSLLGVENENVARAIQKAQGAMTLLNGVQQIGTLLTNKAVAAKLKDITSTIAMAAADKKGTVAQNAWNVAKAVGNALLGNWAGIALVAAAGIGVYAMATAGSTKEQEKQAKATDGQMKAMDSYQSTMQDTYAKLMTDYTKLKVEWSKLSSEHKKNKWIEENKNKLQDLGIACDNAKKVEEAFGSNTSDIVKAFEKRARAAALLAKATEVYAKQMELADKIANLQAAHAADAAKNPKVKAGDKITNDTHRSKRYGSVDRDGEWRYSEAGAVLNNTGQSDSNPIMNKLQADLDEAKKEGERLSSEYAKLIEDSTTLTSSKKPGGSEKPKPEEKPDAGSRAALQAEADLINKKLDTKNLTQEQRDVEIKKLDNLKQQIEVLDRQKKIHEDLRTEAQKQIELEQKRLEKLEELNQKNQELSRVKPEQSSYDKHKNPEKDYIGEYQSVKAGEAPTMDVSFDDLFDQLQTQMDFNDQLIEKLKSLKEEYEELGDTGSEAYQNVCSEIENLNNTQAELGGIVEEASEQQVEAQDKVKGWESAQEIAGNTGQAFGALGKAFAATGNEGAAAAMQIMGATADMIAQVIPQIMSLLGVKQAEAMASGTASAAAMPFPANIAAIASVIATVVGTFASIMSAVGSFADGGIIPGSSFHGDSTIAKVNAGEMILNKTQQGNLFRLLDSGGSNAMSQSLNFKIKGSDLYGTLTNYKKSAGRTINIK